MGGRESGSSERTVLLRPRSAEVICGLVWLLCTALLVDAVVRAGLPGLRVVPVLALGAAVAWALLWAPRVLVGSGSIEVRNLLRTLHLPFAAIRAVRLGAMLRFDVAGADGRVRTVTAWNAPALGRDHPHRHRERATVGERAPRHVGPAERLARDQESSASAIVRERWERWADARESEAAGGRTAGDGADDVHARARTSWNLAPMAVVLIAALAVMIRYAL